VSVALGAIRPLGTKICPTATGILNAKKPLAMTVNRNMTAKTDFKSVDEYVATYPEDVQAILQRVRRTICKAVPAAKEVISYQIPAYKLQGAPVLYFAGWKQHYSLYPATDTSSRRSRTNLHRTRSLRARSASRSPSPFP
jgi:uncharacterized protein DUF1801